MGYTKEIEVSSTGMVIARVKDSKGNTKGLEFFGSIIRTNKAVEKKCKKAHKWADDRIAMCERQEI